METDQSTEGFGIDNSPDLIGGNWEDYPIKEFMVRSEVRSIFEIIRRVDAGHYILDPEFQRDFIWPEVNQSRLIESVLMRIPLPVFYFAERSDGKVIVVDGLQRLTTFRRFISGKLKLKKVFREFKDKKFGDLDAQMRHRFEDTNLTVYLLDSKAPERAKLDIFERVNSGVPLSRQQMRNSLHTGQATRWLKAMAESEFFYDATSGGVSPKTMRDREVINRFCSFHVLGMQAYLEGKYKKRTWYKADMDDFLGVSLDVINKDFSDADLKALSNSFEIAMVNACILFDHQAFRKPSKSSSKRRKPINVGLFDSWSTNLADYCPNDIEKNKATILESYHKLFAEKNFEKSVSGATNSRKSVQIRFDMIKKILKDAVNA